MNIVVKWSVYEMGKEKELFGCAQNVYNVSPSAVNFMKSSLDFSKFFGTYTVVIFSSKAPGGLSYHVAKATKQEVESYFEPKSSIKKIVEYPGVTKALAHARAKQLLIESGGKYVKKSVV